MSAGLFFAVIALLGAPQESGTPFVPEPGKRVEAKGRLDENGVFVADEATIKEGASTKQEMVGPISSVNPEKKKFVLFGVEVDLEDDGEVLDEDGRAIGFESLADGDWVRVEGKRRTDEFEARKVRLVAKADDERARTLVMEIEALIDSTNGTARMAGFDVLLPRARESWEDEAARVRVGPRVVRAAGRLGYKAVDEEDYRPMRIQLSDDLEGGGRARAEYAIERNFDLDRDRHSSVSEVAFSLDARLAANLTDNLFGFVEGRVRTNQVVYDQDRDLDGDTKTVLGETFLFYKDLGLDGLDVQVGRQDFDEYREWVYDAEIDAARVFYTRPPFVLEASVGSVLIDPSDADEDIVDYIVYASFLPTPKGQYSVYAVDRENRKSSDRRIVFGLRGREEPADDVEGWFEAALSRGEIDGLRLNGYAFDVGATYVVEDSPVEPAFTIGFALASGDRDTDDGENGNFRQTGLEDNNSRWNGVTSFRYYGEVLDPELTNLRLTTLGVGIRPTKRSSVDLVHHYVTQDETAVALLRPISNLRQNTNGEHGVLGHEFDLVVGVKEIENVRIEVVAGTFIPGNAFDRRDGAHFLQVQLDFQF